MFRAAVSQLLVQEEPNFGKNAVNSGLGIDGRVVLLGVLS